jgi:hypothetical protein
MFLPILSGKRRFVGTIFPYVKGGLASNEFCLWVISESRSVIEAEETLKNSAVPCLYINLKVWNITEVRWVKKKTRQVVKKLCTASRFHVSSNPRDDEK